MELRQAHQSVQPFRTQDEYLYAMKEDLAEWFNGLYDLDIGVNNFFEQLENGVVICRHANNVQHHILQQLQRMEDAPLVGTKGSPVERRRNSSAGLSGEGAFGIYYRTNVRPGTFQSRDNISNFIAWCRNTLQIPETLLFETDDLVLRKNERNVVLCLLEVARRGSRFGLPVPVLVQLEQEIDAEIAAETDGANIYQILGNQPLRKRNPIKVDMISLDELVRDVLGRCTCPDQFPMIKVSDGKYKIGDSLTMIFLRILRSHVMVRIGGGWDTLENYLNRHDPCRCQYKAGHAPLNTWSATATRDEAISMTRPLEESNGTRSTPDRKSAKSRVAEVHSVANGISDKSKNLTTSVKKAPPATDTTDSNSISNGVAFPRRQSDEVSKHNPSDIHSSQSNQVHDSDRRFQGLMTGKSRHSNTTLGTALGTGSIPDLVIGSTNRGRSSAGSPFHRRAQSSERQPRITEQVPQPRPASATGRARSVDPLGTELSRTLPRSAYRSRERSAKDSDVLIIARNKDGKHRVKDSRKEQDTKVNSAERTSSPNDKLPTKYPQQQQQQSITKASRMPINTEKVHHNKPRPLVVRSMYSSLENKESVERSEAEGSSNHELKRSSSFDATPATKERDNGRTTGGTVEIRSPLSPTNPDLLLEEYRKIGLDIQDLIRNTEDLDNSRCRADGQSRNEVRNDDRNLQNLLEASPDRNEALAESGRRVSTTARHSSSHLNNSTSTIVQPACQTEGQGQCSSSPAQRYVSGLEKDQGLGATVERSRRTTKAVDRKLPRTLSCTREPVTEMTLPRSSSVTRNQRALSCASRGAQGRTMDEDCDSGGPNRTGIRVDPRRMGCEEDVSSKRRSRTAFPRNRDNRLSRGSDELVSDTTRQNTVSTPLRKPRAASNTRCPSTELDDPRRLDVTSLEATDDSDHGTIVDDYCRKALIRKDIKDLFRAEPNPGQKRLSRIPMPVDVKQSLQIDAHHKGYAYEQLKRFDSGVDINSVPPID